MLGGRTLKLAIGLGKGRCTRLLSIAEMPDHAATDDGRNSILKFFQVDITGMFRMTSSARYFKEGVGSSRLN